MTKKPSVTERKLSRTKEFLDQWLIFHDLFLKSRAPESITREDEDRFLKVKSEIARRHQILMDFLQDDYVGGEPITELLRSTVNLRTISASAYEHYVQMESKWHNTFLSLNETLGHLRYKLEGAP